MLAKGTGGRVPLRRREILLSSQTVHVHAKKVALCTTDWLVRTGSVPRVAPSAQPRLLSAADPTDVVHLPTFYSMLHDGGNPKQEGHVSDDIPELGGFARWECRVLLVVRPVCSGSLQVKSSPGFRHSFCEGWPLVINLGSDSWDEAAELRLITFPVQRS